MSHFNKIATEVMIEQAEIVSLHNKYTCTDKPLA